VNLTLTFDKNTLKRNLTANSKIYCKDKSSRKWEGSVVSATKFNCIIKYTDHNTTTLDLQIVLEIPSITSNDILLSQNFATFYFLEKKPIRFASENQTQFEYTSKHLPVNLTIDTFIPPSLRKNVYCKFSDSQVKESTYFINSAGNVHNIMCNVTSPTDGVKNVSLWFADSYHSIEISSNGLELVFTTQKKIFSFYPTAVKLNRTTKLSVSSLFKTNVNYGIYEYFCEYGYNSTGVFVSPLTVDNGVFSCPVTLQIEYTAFMKIWLKTKNILISITAVEYFSVIGTSLNYFEPSFGTPEGGKTVPLFNFKSIVVHS
jgi:uncharacterized protein involved in tolerance to divalent cations